MKPSRTRVARNLQADEMVSRTRRQYEQHVQELERQLKNSQIARSTTMTNLEELVLAGHGFPRSLAEHLTGLRHQILDELRRGHEELEQDIAAKSDLLRSHKAPNGHSAAQPPARGSSSYYVYDKRAMVISATVLPLFLELGTRIQTHRNDPPLPRLSRIPAPVANAYDFAPHADPRPPSRVGRERDEVRPARTAYQSLIQEAGVDESMISTLQSTLEKYKSQADKHMENWRRTTLELEKQTATLRGASGRRPGSVVGELLGSRVERRLVCVR